ncbi:uncharacterized protein LOC128983611 [Macrosteles quadrilineatus]|uniref:uncharacterized protein LOC128983611 n=1 Tax=Macrosteles quadrilineatus TaxID=74068 RepID=UPI0023E264DB|nr:uncharacterized protein LOC128983611 [Macrosteles quadrilineatus]
MYVVWSSASVVLAVLTAVLAVPGPQFSVPSLLWYPVPLLQTADSVPVAATVPMLMPMPMPATARKVIAPAASAPVADNTLGVTVAKQRNPGCPYCDSSVYPYCSDKLLHDACCCLNPYDQGGLPPQCQLADCSFLHANSCKEHRLITRCCCDRLLYIKR